MDALGEVTDTTIGIDGRSKVEARIRQLEGGSRLKETAKSSAAMSQVRATEDVVLTAIGERVGLARRGWL